MSSSASGDLVATLRSELAQVEPTRACCRAAERAGLGAAAQGRARTLQVGRLAVRLEDAQAGATEFRWEHAAEHCRAAYLRGSFLAAGSLSVTGAGTHLEMTVPAPELDAWACRLADIGLPAGTRLRRGRGVLTWKSAELVTDLLRLMGASGSTLEIDVRLVNRALIGHLNRVVNAENANLRRAVGAARRQLDDIETLERRGDLDQLTRDARRIAGARRRAPEATLAELADEVGMSRSRVQRAFEQIGSVALHDHQEREEAGSWT